MLLPFIIFTKMRDEDAGSPLFLRIMQAETTNDSAKELAGKTSM
jgi:hypothetical protein